MSSRFQLQAKEPDEFRLCAFCISLLHICLKKKKKPRPKFILILSPLELQAEDKNHITGDYPYSTRLARR